MIVVCDDDRTLFSVNARQSASALATIGKSKQSDDDAGAYDVLKRLLATCRRPSPLTHSYKRRSLDNDDDADANDDQDQDQNGHEEEDDNENGENGACVDDFKDMWSLSEYDDDASVASSCGGGGVAGRGRRRNKAGGHEKCAALAFRADASAAAVRMDDPALFKCKVEVNGKRSRFYKLKVLPCLEAVPTVYAWAPIQQNIYVIICFSFFCLRKIDFQF